MSTERWWQMLHRELQDPEYKAAYLEACEELGTDPDLAVVERLAKGQEQADE